MARGLSDNQIKILRIINDLENHGGLANPDDTITHQSIQCKAIDRGERPDRPVRPIRHGRR